MADKKDYVTCTLCGIEFWAHDPKTLHYDRTHGAKPIEPVHICRYCTQDIKRELDAQDKET